VKYFSKSARPTRDFKVLQSGIEQGLILSKEYENHLKNIAPRLPDVTRSFVLTAWYRDPKSHDCPHDAWLIECSLKTDIDDRQTSNLRLVLLGAYHDRVLILDYCKVTELTLDFADVPELMMGDWLHDEFDVTGSGLVSHEIQWQNGLPWRIVSQRVKFTANPR